MGRHRQRACVRILLLALLVPRAFPADAAVDVPVPGEPGVSAGDLRYHARATAFRHGETEARAEFFIRIPYREIRFVAVGNRFEAHLRLTAELLRKDGKRVAYERREARVASTDADATVDSLLGEVYTLGLVAPRGRYHYSLTVEDMNQARRGLVYQMKNKKKQGEVRGEIDMGAWLFQNPALSGIEFAWNVGPATPETPFARGPYEIPPHPSGYYGHFRDVLSAYYEIYDAPAPSEGRAYRLRTMILGARGDTLMNEVDSLRVAEGIAWPHVVSADIAALPAGHYLLRLDLFREAGQPAAGSQAEFDVLWDPQSWNSDAVDVFDITAATIMTGKQATSFRQLSRGEKEATLANTWRSIDPTPDTAENELRRTLLARIAYANAHFTIYEKGMFSDRGRTWIRYGEPDEILDERLPVSESTLGYVIQGQIPKSSSDMLSRGDTGVVDERPYQIWWYTLRGHEIVPQHAMNELNSGMKFIFVDDQGYGEYVLRYSSVSGIR